LGKVSRSSVLTCVLERARFLKERLMGKEIIALEALVGSRRGQNVQQIKTLILLILLILLIYQYINNCPTRCNTKQSVYYSASSLYMFRVSTTPIMRRASLATLEGGICTKNMASNGGCSYSFVYSWPRWRKVAAQKI